MPYPKKLLNEGEDIALDLRPHWWYFWKHIVSGIVLLVAIIAILGWLDGTVRDWTFAVWGVIALVFAVWVLLRYLQWNFTHFVVTTDRVIYRTGVLAKRGVEIPHERINNINFNQGIWERVIGAGDLAIESAGRDGQSRFEDVWHPDGVQQEIYRMMEGNARKRASWNQPQAGATPAAAAAPPANVADQLHQLGDLRDRGVITPEEFEAKKAELLDRM